MTLNCNKRTRSQKAKAWLRTMPLAFLLTACANMGAGPQGGPKDVTPPKFINSVPAPNQKGYNNQKVTIYFDEYISLKDPYSKVVVSPPQSTPISVSALGKKVTVELGDTLEANRTYIIDFANAIADNNEGNELTNYYISFSTGNEIDSFEVSGQIIDAQTLAPMAGIYVGAYESGADTAFTNNKMDYVAKTDDKGFFRIRGLKEKEYSIYGLKDNNSNFKFDDKSEGIAVLGAPVKTRRITTIKYDTTYKDSTTIDTIIAKSTSRYEPDSLLMRFFNEKTHLQYYKNATWKEKEHFTLNFVNEKKELPTITPLNFNSKDWYRVETGVTFDTLTYWLSDTMVANLDTIKFAIDYEKTDSAGVFFSKRDTITLLSKKWRVDKKYKGPNFKSTKKLDFFKMPVLTWDNPIEELTSEKVKLAIKKDSTWQEIACKVETLDPRNHRIIADYEQDGQYKITVDSAMVKDLMGIENKSKCEGYFTVRNQSEFTKLDLKIKNTKEKTIVELLNQKEQVVKRTELVGEKASFANLEPGDYYVRLFEDRDGDGEWTTGDYKLKREPEQTYYYPKKLTLRANWEREEEWDITEVSLPQQRPSELVSNVKKKK